MSDLPENQKTPLGKGKKTRTPVMQRIVHNPMLVSLRHVNGKQRHIHCISVDVLEGRIGVTFRGPKERERYFTEWFDRKFWHLITGDEKKAYYQKKEEYRALVKDEAYQKRVAERLARENRKMRRLGISTPEELEALKKKRHQRRQEIAHEINEKNRITLVEDPTPEPEPEPTAAQPPAPVPVAADPDALTQAEEEALNGPVRPFPEKRVGNLDDELPGEYNAMLHMKKDKYPFGNPDDLKIFDALVTAEAVKQEALRKLAQRKRTLQTRQAIERGESVWTSE